MSPCFSKTDHFEHIDSFISLRPNQFTLHKIIYVKTWWSMHVKYDTRCSWLYQIYSHCTGEEWSPYNAKLLTCVDNTKVCNFQTELSLSLYISQTNFIISITITIGSNALHNNEQYNEASLLFVFLFVFFLFFFAHYLQNRSNTYSCSISTLGGMVYITQCDFMQNFDEGCVVNTVQKTFA